MAKNKNFINKTISKIESVKKINDNPAILTDYLYDNYGKNLTSGVDSLFNNIKNTSHKNNNQQTDIFNNIIEISKSFLGDNSDKKLLRYTKESTLHTLKNSKNIVTEEFMKIFTPGVNSICNNNITMTNKTYHISPTEFDIMNVLKTQPNSLTGKILYEDKNNIGGIKYNNELYNQFNSNTPYTFTSVSGVDLFNIRWDGNNQVYNVTVIPETIEMKDFFGNYYQTIEYPQSDYVIKKTMLLLLQSDGSEDIGGLNDVERFIKKLLSYCNIFNTESKPLKNNPTDVFNDDDVDTNMFFDFNDTEGISLDDEDSRYRRVLKFIDCNKFEIPVNTNHIEDFVYLNNFDDDSIINTLTKSSNDVDPNSNNHLFYLSLLNSYITKIPIALMSVILSPKMLFPLSLGYKVVENITTSDTENNIKVLMRKLKRFFINVIGRLFKIFILHFWGLIRRELLMFLSNVVQKILLNKIKRYKKIILSLIALLTSLLTTEINSCNDLFKIIDFTIDKAFSSSGNIPIPGLLLSFSDKLPGYSTDRAIMNILERMENAGIPTGPIYGQPNFLTLTVRTIIDGHMDETDKHSFVKISNKEINLAKYGVPFVLPPGILDGSGKMF